MRLPRLLGRSVPLADLRAVKLRLRTAEFARSAAELALSDEKQKVAALLPERIRADVAEGELAKADDDLATVAGRLHIIQDVSAGRALRIVQLENAIGQFLVHEVGRKGYAAARKALAQEVGR